MTLRDSGHNLNLEFTHYFALLCRLKAKTTTLRNKSTYRKLILGELASTNKKSYYGQGNCLKNCNFRSGPSWVDLPVITAPPNVIHTNNFSRKMTDKFEKTLAIEYTVWIHPPRYCVFIFGFNIDVWSIIPRIYF